MSVIKVVPVPVNADNLSYLIIDVGTKQAFAVDPAEPAKVIAAAAAEGVTIAAILTTHWHKDHAGGNAELAALVNVPVRGASSKVEAVSELVRDGDVLELGALRVTVRAVPFHTLDSVLLIVDAGHELHVFTGDSIFAAGVGRFFEGDASMCDAAFKIFKSLDASAFVWFGHEYTVANNRFALSVDPDNEELQKVAALAIQQRAEGLCTAPSTVGRELATNPFLRCESEAIRKAVGGNNAVETLHLLRLAKNNFA